MSLSAIPEPNMNESTCSLFEMFLVSFAHKSTEKGWLTFSEVPLDHCVLAKIRQMPCEIRFQDVFIFIVLTLTLNFFTSVSHS